MSQETLQVKRWLDYVLSNDPLLQTIVHDRVFDTMTDKEDEETPLILYQEQAAGITLMGVGRDLWKQDFVYLVRGIDEVPGFSGSLATVASRIHVLLHGARGSVPGGGYVLACVREQPFQLIEPATEKGGATYRHLGGMYRIQVQS
jgi:hypothetical protein